MARVAVEGSLFAFNAPTPSSRKLPQKPHIVLEKHRQFTQPILHHRQAIDAHPERKPRKPFRIVIHKSIHRRIHHPSAKKLDPARLLANPAAASAAHMAARVHFRRRLRERKITRPQPSFYLRPEKRAHEIFHGSLEIAEGDVRVDGEP